MLTLLLAFLASAAPNISSGDLRAELRPVFAPVQEPSASPESPQSRITLRRDGGPGAGPDQPYNVREQGASDLQEFVGGRQVVFVEPWDFLFLLALVGLVVLIIIII